MQKHHMAEHADFASANEIHLDDLQLDLAKIDKLLHVTAIASMSRDGALVASEVGTILYMVRETLEGLQKDLTAATAADYQISDLFEARDRARLLYGQGLLSSATFDAAEAAFLSYRPFTLDGVHEKAERILGDQALFQSLLNETGLRLFLTSLVYRAGGTLQ